MTMETVALQDAATEQQSLRCAEHPWKERIADWIGVQKPVPRFLTGRESFLGAMGGMDVRFDTKAQHDVSKAMRDLGWSAGFKSLGHARTMRGYWHMDAERGEKFGPGVVVKKAVDTVSELW